MAENMRGHAIPHLKAWRMRRFLAQAELATRAGVGKSTVTRAERGDTVVSFANIRKIAAALGVTPEELLAAPSAEPSDRAPRPRAKKSH